MRADADIAILGAGCAGLSLATALASRRVPGRVMLLEPRTEYARDRTWCFWNTEEHLFTSEISHSWNSWRVSSGGRTALQQSRRYRYCHIAGDAFYRVAIDRVQREPGQELSLGTAVHSAEPHASGLVAIETSAGRLFAKQVFDSRPPAAGLSMQAPMLLQRFVGWHIRTADPCFAPNTAELMHFLPSDTPDRTRFLYLLPFSSTEALVEMTYLDSPSLPEPPYTRDLEAWLREQVGAWEVLYTEQGSLPMQPASILPSGSLNVHPIGIRGGRIKPSSGYAFLRMQRHSRAIAHALEQGRPIPTSAEPAFYGWMDAVFLRALEQSPGAAPDLFLRMFARTEPDALVRFLSEASDGPGETLRVAWSLPKLPMIRAAATYPFRTKIAPAKSLATLASGSESGVEL
jgi:lycopene beta-cyclase